MTEKRRLKVKSLNSYISCYICKGYLIDATTVIDCLHTFCRSCLLKHFEEDKTCPKCETLIHQSHPAHYVAFDRTMQDLVYKLVPHLQDREKKRREKFFSSRGIAYDSGQIETVDEEAILKEKAERDAQESDFHRRDEQANIVLIHEEGAGLTRVSREFLRCSVHATVAQIRKFISIHAFGDLSHFRDIDILCNNELMGKDHSIKFIQLTRWRTKMDEPIELKYRKHIDL